jgi:hypothetical protein
MVIADDHSNLRHRGVVILLMVNDCNGAGLMAYTGRVDHLGDLMVGDQLCRR